MSAENLTQIEIEQIHAFLDGELPAEQAEQVAARIQRNGAWSAEADGYRQLDALLSIWRAPPLRRDLTQAILAKTARKHGFPAWVRLLAPVAAAAMIFVAVWVFHAVGTGNGGSDRIATPSPQPNLPADWVSLVDDLPADDRFAVENLDLFVNYEILSSFETLEAIERLESSTGGA